MFHVKQNGSILLINPWIYDFAAFDLWAKPLGLLYIAALLRSRGHEIDYIDCLDIHDSTMIRERGVPKRKQYHQGHFFKEDVDKPPALANIPRKYSRYGISEEAFRERLESLREPKVVLVTSIMTYWYPGPFHVIRLVKERFPKSFVVLGGIYATLCSDHARRYSGADYVLPGEGPAKILTLVGKLLGVSMREIPRGRGLDSLPYPAFDLYPILDYGSILTSLGCPYRCDYCASWKITCGFSRRDPNRVVDEIELWTSTFEIQDIAFYDDALLGDSEKHFIPMAKEILRRGIRCRFHTPNGVHGRELSAEIASLMYAVGFKTVRLGLETSDTIRQKRIGDKITNSEMESAITYLREAGFSGEDIGVYILAGLPGQRVSEVEESIRFVRACGATPKLAEYSPIPQTLLWETALRLSEFDLSGEPLFHNNSILPCRWEGFTWEDLQESKLGLRALKRGSRSHNVSFHNISPPALQGKV
ncbi:MAG: B12-binding domain-containing radical SAM protein [Thermodesulfobacteriota bacterium]